MTLGRPVPARRAWADGEPLNVSPYVRSTIRTVRPDDVTVRKPLTPPDAVAEVDYGRLGRRLDRIDQRWRTVWAFVMALAYSRMTFVQPVIGCDEASWVAAHVAAVACFGGAGRRLCSRAGAALTAKSCEEHTSIAPRRLRHVEVILFPGGSSHVRNRLSRSGQVGDA